MGTLSPPGPLPGVHPGGRGFGEPGTQPRQAGWGPNGRSWGAGPRCEGMGQWRGSACRKGDSRCGGRCVTTGLPASSPCALPGSHLASRAFCTPFPWARPTPNDLQPQGFQGQAEPFQKLCLHYFQSSCSPVPGRRRGHAPRFISGETERGNGSPKVPTSS